MKQLKYLTIIPAIIFLVGNTFAQVPDIVKVVLNNKWKTKHVKELLDDLTNKFRESHEEGNDRMNNNEASIIVNYGRCCFSSKNPHSLTLSIRFDAGKLASETFRRFIITENRVLL